MTRDTLKYLQKVSISTLVKLVFFLAMVLAAWYKYKDEVDLVLEQHSEILSHINRIEKYLSSQDPEYWKIVGDLPGLPAGRSGGKKK